MGKNFETTRFTFTCSCEEQHTNTVTTASVKTVIHPGSGKMQNYVLYEHHQAETGGHPKTVLNTATPQTIFSNHTSTSGSSLHASLA